VGSAGKNGEWGGGDEEVAQRRSGGAGKNNKDEVDDEHEHKNEIENASKIQRSDEDFDALSKEMKALKSLMIARAEQQNAVVSPQRYRVQIPPRSCLLLLTPPRLSSFLLNPPRSLPSLILLHIPSHSSSATSYSAAPIDETYRSKDENILYIRQLEASASTAVTQELRAAEVRAVELTRKNTSLAEEVASYQTYIKSTIPQYKKQVTHLKKQLAAMAGAVTAKQLLTGAEGTDLEGKLPIIKGHNP
jgi:hypothetical protein